MDNFIRREKCSWPKNIQKMGFLGFSHITTPKRFAFLLWCCDDAQVYRMVAYLIGQRAPVIKWTTLWEEKKFWSKKPQKSGFFGVFTHYCTKSLRNFTLGLLWCSNLQDSRLFDCARCASNKMDNFFRRKKFLGQKTSKNWVFWGFHTLLHQIASQFYFRAPMMLKLTG